MLESSRAWFRCDGIANRMATSTPVPGTGSGREGGSGIFAFESILLNTVDCKGRRITVSRRSSINSLAVNDQSNGETVSSAFALSLGLIANWVDKGWSI